MRDRYNAWARKQIEEAEAKAKLKKEEDQKRESKKFDLKSMATPELDEILKARLTKQGKNTKDFKVTGFAIGMFFEQNVFIAKVEFVADCCEWKVISNYPLKEFVKGVEWIPQDVYEKGKIEFVGFVDDYLQPENFKEEMK
ncbi:hypothetical protein EOM81_08365 [bacterium]|nr:hypothetical protein [bacterium]